MSSATETRLKSYVIVPIGGRRFSLAAESVVELISIGTLQQFPHQTPWISGVIVRRGRVVPVCDLGPRLGERNESIGRFHLIAEWQVDETRDWCAIPVAGECELASAEAAEQADDNAGNQEPYITGSFQVGEDRIQILDLGKLIQGFEASREAHLPEPGS
ncbi:MAG: chemotaxis protein CheW [Candidatus Acidiferrales bacterium]